MKIVVLCSSSEHPIFPRLIQWVRNHRSEHDVELVNESKTLSGGDILFLIACSEIIRSEVRKTFTHTLVVHASALPEGRGWSPHIWQLIEGKNTIPITLLEAEDVVDSGDIWKQVDIQLEGHELYDEINAELFAATLRLMDFAVENESSVRPTAQRATPATYYARRTPADSELDPEKTIAEQFDLLRVADPDRFPCFIELRGKRYSVTLRKAD